MPPTDMMKTLSRADQKVSYIKFVISLNIGRYIDKQKIYNVLPYTVSILLHDEIYKCLGMNLCEKDNIAPMISYHDNISMENTVIAFRGESKICYDRKDAVLYLFNNDMNIISKNDLKTVTILKDDYSVSEYLYRIDDKLSEKRVIGVTLYYGTGNTLSISSMNPFSFECLNRRLCIAEQIHVDPMFLLSRRSLISLIRKLLVRNSIEEINLEMKLRKPIMEFLDMTTLINSMEFYEDHIRMKVKNVMSRPMNSVLRSWIPITRVILDETIEYSNKYGIIRLALPAYESALMDIYFNPFVPRTSFPS